MLNFMIFLCPCDDSQRALRFAHVRLPVHLSVHPFVTLYSIEFVSTTPTVLKGSFLNLAYLLWTY